MDFIADMKGTVKLDSRTRSFQDGLRNKLKFEVKDLFLLTVVLGYKRSKKSSSYETGGLEFRPVYLTEEDRSILYAIAFDIYGDDLFKKLKSTDFQRDLFNEFFKYSNGGLNILYEQVFKEKMTENQFRNGYNDYDTHLLNYIFQALQEVPF